VKVELHPEARAELRSAAIWYDQRRVGLGDEFISNVAAVIDRIRVAADSFPRWPGLRADVTPIRRATLHRFPYVIAFEEQARRLVVPAVAYAKRQAALLARAPRCVNVPPGELSRLFDSGSPFATSMRTRS
jgi:hypothetical protein